MTVRAPGSRHSLFVKSTAALRLGPGDRILSGVTKLQGVLLSVQDDPI